eukprot:524632_1
MYLVLLLHICIIIVHSQNNLNNLLCNYSLWSANYNASWEYSNGNCSYTSLIQYQGTILWLGDNYKQSLNWSNYRITILVQLVLGVDASVIFRAQDSKALFSEGNKYVLGIHDTYVRLWKSHDGYGTALYSNKIPRSNKIRNVTIYVISNKYTIFIDSTFIFEYIDNCAPIYYYGSIGIRSYLSTSVFSFLNVRHNPPTLIKQTFNTLNQLQQNALTDLYTSTNGNQWHQTWNLTKLKTDEACTELCGVICSSNDINETVVVSLALVANNLSGTIPASLKYLTSLLHIDLANNFLFGEIPDIFDQFPITNLFLVNNQLNSTLPTSFMHAKHLKSLDLSNNINITGSLNTLTNCSSLIELDCVNTNFTGTISNTFCDNKDFIRLNIQNNTYLQGTIPSCIGNWKHLTALIITNNNISGSIPYSLCNLSSVSRISLYGMQLTSSIPDCISNLQHLYQLILSNNNLNSSIPKSICQLYNLRNLILSQNYLTGDIPVCIWS